MNTCVKKTESRAITKYGLVFFVLFFGWPSIAGSQETDSNETSTYKFVGLTQRWKNLRAPYDIIGTKDGKYFYVSSYKNGGIGIFERNSDRGTITNKAVLGGRPGFIHLDLSEDGTRAVGCSYRDGLYLFDRDPSNGSLKEIYHLKNSDEIENSLASPFSLELSPDGRFVYVANGSDDSSLSVFEITAEGEIAFLQKHDGIENCLDGARLMTTDSQKRTLFVASGKAGTLSVFDRDPDAGHVQILSYVNNGQNDITKLDGVHGVALSPDDKFVYVVGGRFGGSHSVCVFEIQPEKQLKLVQQWEAAKDSPFNGGSHIGVSPDGKHVVATGWGTKNIALFSRDLSTGKIMFQEFLYNTAVNIGKATQPFFSPDGKHLYLGSYSGNVITFSRKD